MSVWRLIRREMTYRRGNACLSLFLVAAAVACFVASVLLLRVQEEQVQAASTNLEEAGKALDDEMRKITLGLGFNIVVLSGDEDLQQFTLSGVPAGTMPESHVDKLSNSKLVKINHLLPIVTREIEWPETGKTIVLTGTRGEVPIAHKAMKKPLQDQVPQGTMIVGYQLAQQLDLKPGSKTTLLEREFTVGKVRQELGDVQDSTVWINLAEAQEMLGMQNLVNAILALECNCQAVDRIAEVRDELAGILPGTQVIERGSKALARAEARTKAKTMAEESKQRAETQLGEQQRFAGVLVPAVLLSAGLWIGLLCFLNVRTRSAEVGILRAIGVKSRQVVAMFLGKAVLIGCVGAVLGLLLGLTVVWGLPTEAVTKPITQYLSWQDVLLALLLAPLLSAIASWIPAVLAARRDPAVVLQGE